MMDEANFPYHSAAFADIILRSSDHVHFYVIGQLLCLVSPVFRDMLEINRGPAAEKNESNRGLPIVPLEEHSETLYLLLDSLYPCTEEPTLHNVNRLWKVGKAVKKYFMDVVEGRLKNRLLISELISREPLGIYAVATDLGWEVVANEAARRTLEIPLESLAFVGQLHGITGLGFYRFLEYRLRCQSSLTPQAEQLMAWPSGFPRLNRAPGATALFDGRTRADLILRSSDSIDFFVIEAFLCHISPVLDAMFPLLHHETHDGRAVIFVEESSKVLHPLLSIIYHHTDELDMRDCDTFKNVVASMRKYEMVTIEQRLHKQAAVSPLIMQEPLCVFIAATAVGWGDVAKMAALNMLSQPLSDMAWTLNFGLITGADLYYLVQFRFKCGDAAWESLEADEEFMEFGPNTWNKFWSYSRYGPMAISIESLKEKIRTCPRGSTLNSIYADAILQLKSWSTEIRKATGVQGARIMKCHRRMGDVIEEAVSKVIFIIARCDPRNPFRVIGSIWIALTSTVLDRTAGGSEVKVVEMIVVSNINRGSLDLYNTLRCWLRVGIGRKRKLSQILQRW